MRCFWFFHDWSKWSAVITRYHMEQHPVWEPLFPRTCPDRRNVQPIGYSYGGLSLVKVKSQTQKRRCLRCNSEETRRI